MFSKTGTLHGMELPSSKAKNVREYRRLRAVELFESGMKQAAIARALNVTRGAVKANGFPHIGIKGLKLFVIGKSQKIHVGFRKNKKMNYANSWRLALNISAIQEPSGLYPVSES